MNPRLLYAVAVGLLLPVQFALNSALTPYTHSPVATAAVSYSVGALFLTLGLLIAGRGRLSFAPLRGAPVWSFLGGLVGSAYVVSSVVLTRSLGAALAVSLVIAAQVIASLAFDHFGVLGLPRRPFNRQRAAVLVLVLAGLGLQVLR
ncbi:DMT family transporter [Deinococcus oregonensis]|uniref:DMT family transporter n=1 Tax=Deinococcus oregonensis TaxID=1805970 RepID=A0ABV6B2W9_9DEIO